MTIKTYTPDEIRAVLDAHRKWWLGEEDGSRANLRGADLSGANLRDADLSCAYLRGANLRGADLRDANLCDANLCGANLCGADLCGANLRDADLRDANLCDANLCGADLSCAYLRGANLRGADLRGADLSGAYLRGADLSGARLPAFLILPQLGSFIAWKKAGGHVVKLEIPADAHRTSSLVGRKCRAEFVKVLEIDGATEAITDCHGPRTVYRVGEIVRPDKYDDDIRVECSHGIHFFMTREEAQEW